MKKTRLLLMLACSLFVVTAQAKSYQVGVALANFDLNFVSILRSQMARELAAQQLQGQFVDAKGDVALQVQQVDDLINQGVDAIILNPVDTQGVQPMVEKQTAKWQRNEAVDVVSGWLLNGTPIDAIAANNDEMAIGAIMALKQAKKSGVLVAGIDGTPDGLQFIKNGDLAVTIFQDAKAQAIGAVQVTRAMLDHAKTEPYNWVPYATVTRENYPQFAQMNQK